MDEDKLLRGACSWQWKHRETTQRLGANVETYINSRGRDLKKNARVVDAWRQLLPEQLSDNCKISGISGGVLRVEVEPGPYMHELRLISAELVEQLERMCGSATIKRIVLRPMKDMTIQAED